MLAPGGIVGNAGGPYKTFKGAVNIHAAEVHTRLVNELFHLHTGIINTLAVDVNSGDTAIQLVNATGFPAGSVLQINDGQIETTFPIITDLPGGNVLTLDRPLDFGYLTGNQVEIVHTDLRTTVGSLAAPVIHKIMPAPGEIWYINRIIITMTHTVEATDDKFGGITALTNGIVLRANVNGQFGSFTNWKTNGDIIGDMYDVRYSDKAGPSLFGTSARGSFSRIGVSVRLDGNVGDFLDVLVQDDITGQSSFFINAQGYIEDAS